ncbi:shugoshin 1 [Heteronotia binoei]|uniref:shugoshin 1 n=1 Tax=Heteronotia binoei TaxID=13085 RepID=UPI00293197BC|nr:shugoshin 1 [Heteronotia binoei]XP_060104754.1 shugoshin 1 [Heteronotia binoei]XP_060104755.1 shugoshin 1 [Heteronotia binoei]XP_060104756.1 shugoshin 1 [Heteronotia binoei]
MAREKCLKKSFKDTLEDIKERMKGKRNQRLAKMGRSYVLSKSTSALSSKDDTSMQLKNFQANNRALVLALEEEKSKMREAQDVILYLKREYQSLKFQMLALQRQVDLQQEKEHVETRLLMVKKIISKAVQNLLEATNLLDPAKDLYTTEDSQSVCLSALEKYDSTPRRNETAAAILKPDLAVTVNRKGKTFTSELEDKADKNYLDFVSDSWLDMENISTGLMLQINKGCQNSSLEDCQLFDSRNTSSNEENKQVSNSLPKNISTRRHYSKNQHQSEFCVSDRNNLEITDQIKESFEQDKIRPEKDLEINNEQFEEVHSCAENTQFEEVHSCVESIYDTNGDQSLVCSYMLAESSTSTTDLKEADVNSIVDSQTQKGRGQKRKLEEVKNSSRTRSKKKSQSKRSCSKEKADSSAGPSDAYNFIFEESVHITPFRQNKENESITDNKSYTEETCSDSLSDDNSDDSLYVPYKNKSKSGKTLSHGIDAAPICTRRQCKNTISEQHESTEGKMSIGEYGGDMSVTEENRSNSVPKIAGKVPCPVFTEVDKEKEHKMSSSESINFNTDKHSENLQKICHLGDITNLTSPSIKTRDCHPPIITGEKDSSHHRRRCTISMCYKEPPINRKLRRGDPFTDTGFLNSPIFKEKKSSKYKPVKKKSLSRYNEAYVGCL